MATTFKKDDKGERETASIPAFKLNDEHQNFARRLAHTANYQLANTYLAAALLIVSALCGWTIYALHQNSEVLKHFKPRVVRENELGQTELLIHQDINMDPDQRSIRSALHFWAAYHFDHVKATIGSFRSQSFTWMPKGYADSIRSDDRRTEYIRTAMTGSEPEYRVEVVNSILTTAARKVDEEEKGEADIFAHRRYIESGIPKPINPKDAFVVHVKWELAADVPDNVVALNPLGIEVTYYTIFNSTN